MISSGLQAAAATGVIHLGSRLPRRNGAAAGHGVRCRVRPLQPRQHVKSRTAAAAAIL